MATVQKRSTLPTIRQEIFLPTGDPARDIQHYFSPTQALTLDFMLRYLPSNEPDHSVCLAGTIAAASHCSASPGHTAQPFQPTVRAFPYIIEAWSKNALAIAETALCDLCSRRAQVAGEAHGGDAVSVAATLKPTDLVVVDPPYSAVHYSRFYHVLETVSRGQASEVAGAGRYPPISVRPQSSFSRRSGSAAALSLLMEKLARTGSTIIFTFLAGSSSNGLSGAKVIAEADRWFDVQKSNVS